MARITIRLSEAEQASVAAERYAHRGLTQTRVFLKELGFRWQRTRAVPVPPKSLSPSMSPCSGPF